MDQLKEVFGKIIQKSKSLNAEVELLVTGGERIGISYQNDKMDSFNNSQSQMAGFRVIKDGRQGYAYTENLSEESLFRTFDAAFENSQIMEKSDGEQLTLIEPQAIPHVDGLEAKIDLTLEDKINLAGKMVGLTLKKDSRVTSVPYNSFNEVKSFKRILNSKGIDQTFSQQYLSGYVYALAKEGDKSKMGGEGFFVRNSAELNVDEVASQGVKEATSLLGASTMKTGVYPVVIDREEFAKALMMIEGYISAKDMFEGKSLLKGKENQKVGSDAFTLIDDPLTPLGAGVRPFDDEGAASKVTPIFENGVFKNYLTNFEYAKKLNLPHTANAARSPASQMDISSSTLVVKKGSMSFDDMIKSAPEVVVLKKFTGGLHAGFKNSTGDFSMPAEGFLYKNGQLVGPVDSFVVSGNIIELLSKIVGVGTEYNKTGNSKICPDVLVSDLSIAGASN